MIIGILGNSKFSIQNIIPAIKSSPNMTLGLIGSQRADVNGNLISYDDVIEDPRIELIYIPLPPSLHYIYAKRSLEKGKHVVVEKPISLSSEETTKLLKLSKSKRLFIAENYIFQYHKQWQKLLKTLDNMNENIERVVVDFTFPLINFGDNFRYKKNIGGGGWMDAGAYGLKALLLLGLSPRVESVHRLKMRNNTDVSGLVNFRFGNHGIATINYGMDNAYRSEILIELKNGFLVLEKPFSTKPSDKPNLYFLRNGQKKSIFVDSDNQYSNSLEDYVSCIVNGKYFYYHSDIERMNRLRNEVKIRLK